MINKDFILLTEKMVVFLRQVKERCDAFDKDHVLRDDRIRFVEQEKKDVFRQLDRLFKDAWKLTIASDKNLRQDYQRHFKDNLLPFFAADIEINSHICRKPLGYAGDFITMNYIYDYHAGDYLGSASYEMLINNYTCNIPFSSSNIKRKDYFKRKILDTLQKKENPRILSVGCGSVRELLELLRENKINRPLTFICIDFEKRALDYVRNEIAKIDAPGKQYLSISFVEQDIFSLVENQRIVNKLGESDLIYASGLFDYLRRQTAKNLFLLLFTLLKKGGSMIVCNASLINGSHRAYFEMLGDWVMIYRTEEEMLAWAKGLEGKAAILFERPRGCSSYLFIKLKKK